MKCYIKCAVLVHYFTSPVQLGHQIWETVSVNFKLRGVRSTGSFKLNLIVLG